MSGAINRIGMAALIVGVLAAGCTGRLDSGAAVDALPPTSTPFQPVANPPTPTPTLTPTPAPTITPTFTPSPLPTATPAPICPAKKDGFEPGMLAPGTIVFTPLNGKLGDLKFLTSSMQAPQDFLRQIPCCLYLLRPQAQISPDHKWLALVDRKDDYKQNALVITNGLESSVTVIPKRKYWSDLYGWGKYKRLIVFPSSQNPPGALILLNIFTGPLWEIRPTMPNLYQSQAAVWPGEWENPQYPVYDPALTRAVYAYDDPAAPGSRAIALWDAQKGKELWMLPLLADSEQHSSQPVWSPDAGQFALVTGSEGDRAGDKLVLVSRDGLPSDISLVGLTAPGSLSWSPDGKRIAFSAVSGQTRRLFVLDLAKQVIWDTCITGDTRPVAWSPDGRQFLAWGSPGGEDPPYALVDVEKQEIVPLGFGFYEAVWLAPAAAG